MMRMHSNITKSILYNPISVGLIILTILSLNLFRATLGMIDVDPWGHLLVTKSIYENCHIPYELFNNIIVNKYYATLPSLHIFEAVLHIIMGLPVSITSYSMVFMFIIIIFLIISINIILVKLFKSTSSLLPILFVTTSPYVIVWTQLQTPQLFSHLYMLLTLLILSKIVNRMYRRNFDYGTTLLLILAIFLVEATHGGTGLITLILTILFLFLLSKEKETITTNIILILILISLAWYAYVGYIVILGIHDLFNQLNALLIGKISYESKVRLIMGEPLISKAIRVLYYLFPPFAASSLYVINLRKKKKNVFADTLTIIIVPSIVLGVLLSITTFIPTYRYILVTIHILGLILLGYNINIITSHINTEVNNKREKTGQTHQYISMLIIISILCIWLLGPILLNIVQVRFDSISNTVKPPYMIQLSLSHSDIEYLYFVKDHMSSNMIFISDPMLFASSCFFIPLNIVVKSEEALNGYHYKLYYMNSLLQIFDELKPDYHNILFAFRTRSDVQEFLGSGVPNYQLMSVVSLNDKIYDNNLIISIIRERR